MTDEELMTALKEANAELVKLRTRVNHLENHGNINPVPNLMIIEDTFLKRAFALYGHYLVITFILSIPLGLIALLSSLAF